MREKILDFIKRELIGPDPILPHIQENGEEILLISNPPRLRYGAGILFPRTSIAMDYDSTNAKENFEAEELPEVETEDPVQADDTNVSAKQTDDYEEEIGLANTFLPAAMGFSCFSVIPKDGFTITVKAGIYKLQDYTYKTEKGINKNTKAFYRIPIDQRIIINAEEIPSEAGKNIERKLKTKDNAEVNLKLNLRNRMQNVNGKEIINLFTFTLINCNEGIKGSLSNEDCFFQVFFDVEANENCFRPYYVHLNSEGLEDEMTNRLLYRNKNTFAIGHGCAPKWDEEKYAVNRIFTETVPHYEVKPILPSELRSVELDMLEFSDLTDKNFIERLDKLNSEYEKWIENQEKIAKNTLQGEYLETAQKHIDSCRFCLKRMREGLKLLDSNKNVKRAFQLMNRAMLLQQLRYNIDLRRWLPEENKTLKLEKTDLPDETRTDTWKKGLGKWRPFQIAFILMNLNSIYDFKNDERELVDLIWFPTGGGKTEAYLGLTAFTIFLKRIKDKNNDGTTVLMRYTLRLLTAQQFQRAASLICACEIIRKQTVKELGESRITIGLWVGESLTPNDRTNAVKIFRKMEQGHEDDNPFVMLKCPWCGAQMGIVKEGNYTRIKGYRKFTIKGKQTIIYKCDNDECEFSALNFNLPLLVIDEDIYDYPPTLMIGTVDKFAMLPWRPEARALFGFRKDANRISPPELIIQDELHLISGPLGSMVGLYETMIDHFCTKDDIKPKIIASTATISRARQQVHQLFGRGNNSVRIFPVQCLTAGDSFFAYENKDDNGRMYVGIFASALPSHATTQVRVISALLQGVKMIEVETEKERDPYWTILNYFNSLRELGHAATLIRADIREYLNALYLRYGLMKGDFKKRFINSHIELTSRIRSSQIPEYLEQLGKSWTGDSPDYPVDMCLATNMISVGVDIQRLGLMTVIGQPKTTSEYIQATSRVGRSKEGPGLVLTIYNCAKPRDRSHYEHFQEYHSKLYSKVEPTSVTPFSTPARERALHAIIIGLIRFYTEKNSHSPKPFPDDATIVEIKKIILGRVKKIDSQEYEATEKLYDEKIKLWKLRQPDEYGGFGVIQNIPLMYPAGSNPSDNVRERAWPTPTSMRNVDATCEAKLINNYINIDSL